MINIAGQKFNYLTAVKPIGKTKKRTIIWECVCECGNKTSADISSLRSGNKKSCGCIMHKPGHIGSNTKHGMFNTDIYKRWERMRRRCKKGYHEHRYYYDKGICVCKEWDNLKDGFQNFYDWAIKNGYKEGLTVDRIDSNGNYCPENCRWADRFQQANNKSNNHKLTFNGETHGISEWDRIIGIPRECLGQRIIKLKWPIERALTEPKKKIERRD